MHLHDRPVGFGLTRIPTQAMIKLIEAYDDLQPGRTLLKKIIYLEEIIFPILQEAVKEQSGVNNGIKNKT